MWFRAGGGSDDEETVELLTLLSAGQKSEAELTFIACI